MSLIGWRYHQFRASYRHHNMLYRLKKLKARTLDTNRRFLSDQSMRVMIVLMACKERQLD